MKKYAWLIFAVLLLNGFICANSTLITVTDENEFVDYLKSRQYDQSQRLLFRGFDLRNSFSLNLSKEIFASDSLGILQAIEFQSMTISAAVLNIFLKKIGTDSLREFIMINSEIEGHVFWPATGQFPSLQVLSCRNTAISEKVLSDIGHKKMPNLRHLTLLNCAIESLTFLKQDSTLTRLEYIDLSQNDLGNRFFNILPYNQPGRLQTLKLNACDLEIKEDDDYDDDKPALSKVLTESAYFVQWEQPFFANLTHLELINKIKYHPKALDFFSDSFFHKMDIFMGIEFTELKNKRRQSVTHALKNKAVTDVKKEILSTIAKYDYRTKRTNFQFENLQNLNIFLHSANAKFAENLNLASDSWHLTDVQYILLSQKLPALKELSLINTALSQEDIGRLMTQYPHLMFNVLTKKTGPLWPVMIEVEKPKGLFIF
jgi:hypothetical protein